MSADAVAPAVPVDAALTAQGVYDASSAQEDAFARVLLLGPAKAGKTTCVVSTAPSPFVINCDGASALKGASNAGAKFLGIDVTSRVAWKRSCQLAVKLANEGKIRSIVVDTISLLSDNLLDEIDLTLQGFDKWNELAAQIVGGVKTLLKAPAHLFLLAHMTPDHDGAAGILPALSGQAKIRVPALVHDWILLDVEAGRKPERQFLLGPQKTWTHSGRNVKRVCAIDANVMTLLAELGVTP